MISTKGPLATLRHRFRGWVTRSLTVQSAALDIQLLEERVLYSATPLPLEAVENADSAGAIDVNLDPLDHPLPSAEQGSAGGPNDPSAGSRAMRSAIFVDESLTHLEQLLAELQIDHDFDLFTIGRESAGIEVVSGSLAASDHLYTAVHFLTHGSDATLQLGETLVTAGNIGLYQTQLESWAVHLDAEADILFYGCDVAGSSQGQALLTMISAWTGADVAASDDLTGHVQLAGDWELEYRIGEITTDVVVGEYAQSQWRELLNLAPDGGETLVNQGTLNDQVTTANGGGKVAMDSAGNYVVVWQDNRSGDSDVWARVFHADGSVKVGEFKVHSGQSSSQELAQVAMSADGNFAVTWSDNRTGPYETYMRLLDADGVAITGDTLVSSLAGQQNFHSLEFAADGSFVVVFQSDSDADIYFQRYDAGGLAQGGNVKVNSVTANIQNSPDIAIAEDGSFIVVWESSDQDGSGYGIYGQRFDAAGTTLGTAFQVNSVTAGNQWLPSVAAASDGSFVVSWESELQDGAGYGIFAQRYNAAGLAQGGEVQVNTYSSGDQGSSHIDLSRDGRFIVTWRSSAQDGASWGVYAQQFDAAGNPRGNETLVNSSTNGSQTDPSIAFMEHQAVVVWSGEGAGDTSGVFAQRFVVNEPPQATNLSAAETYVEDIPLNLVNIVVSDADDANVTVTLTLSNAAAGSLSTGTSGAVTSTFSAGVWTASGAKADVNALLAAVIFSPTPNFSGNFSLATSVSDGLAAPITGTKSFIGTPVNDAPKLDQTGPMSLTTISEDQTANVGNTVAEIIASAGGDRITDVDSGDQEGIAIYSVSSSNGTWQYNIGSGWTAVGSVSFSQSLLLRDTDSLRFLPDGITGGNQSVSFAAWDQTSGSAGSKVNANHYGGSTAFSVALETALLTVTNINDAPSGSDKTVTILENTNYVFASGDFGFSDVDNNNLSAVMISSLPASGTLYLDADADGVADVGEAVTALSTVSLTDINANRLKFRPSGNASGLGYASFNFSVRDNGGNANGGQDTDQSPNTLTIDVTATYAISGTVFEDINYGGGAGRDFVTATATAPGFDIDAEGVTVELYDASGNYVASTVTDVNGAYAFEVVDGIYTVRIVNSTVLSDRAGSASTLIGIQTYRTDASSGSAVSVIDHVGGQRPEQIDALANNGSQTLAELNNAVGRELQSVTTVLVSAEDVSGVDFGFNFDTIVNTNDSGQGSLRQFILNSNALDNTALAQAGQNPGDEVAIFMIADGQAHAGLNTAYTNLLTGTLGVDARAIINLASALPTVTAANTVLDASTQTLLVGNSNPGTVGVGGAASMTVGVGVDGIGGTADDQILNAFERPEVEIRGNGIAASLLHVAAANFTFEGFAVWGNGGDATSTLSIAGVGGHYIQHNLFGADAVGVAQAHTATSQNQFVNVAASVTGATVFHNYVTAASQAGNTLGIYPNINSSNVVLDSNEFSGAITWGTALNAHNSTAVRNYFHNLPSQSLVTFSGPFTNQTIEHNTFANNSDAISLQGTGSGVVRYNLIQGNTSSGITLTTTNSNVDISKNSIYGNGGVGISILGAGSNDGGLTSDANHAMDFPVLTHANLVGSTLTLAGYIGSAPDQSTFAGARVEFFLASPTGSGQTYLGLLIADPNGNFSGSLSVEGVVDTHQITATATLAGAGTSQFAAAWGVNSCPFDLSPNGFTVNENTDTSSGYAVGTLVTADADSGDTFTYTVVGGVDELRFSISGNQLILTDGVLDFETKPNYSVRIRTTDAQGLWYEEELIVTVTDTNDAPAVTGPTSASVNEGGSLIFSTSGAGLISATDIDNENLTVTITADRASLTLAQTLGLTLIDADGSDGSVQFSGSQADINAALDGLLYISTGGYNGSASLEVLIADGQLTNLLTVAIAVTPGQSVFVWDGGGTTNDWTDALNWNFNWVPEADDIVVFNATSAKHAVIDAAFAGHVAEVRVEATFDGTIVQARDFHATGDFYLRGGAFDTAGYALDIDGGFLQNAGSLTIANSQIFAGGNFESTSGTLVASGSTLRLDGAGDQLLRVSEELWSIVVDTGGTLTQGSDLHIGGDLVFNGLSFQAAGFAVSLIGGGAQTVDAAGVSLNDLNITGDASVNVIGELQLTGDLNVESAASLQGIISVAGESSITSLGAFTAGEVRALGNLNLFDSSYSGDGLLVLGGSANQTLTGLGGGMLRNLVVDKTGGVAVAASNLIIEGSVTHVAGNLDVRGVSTTLRGSGLNLDTEGIVWGNVTFDNLATLALGSDMFIDGNLTLASLAGNNLGNGYGLIVAGDVTSNVHDVVGDFGVRLNGSGNQTISGGDLTNGTLVIDKLFGEVYLGDDLTLNGLNQDVIVRAGALHLNGKTVTTSGQLSIDGGTLHGAGAVTNNLILDNAGTISLSATSTDDYEQLLVGGTAQLSSGSIQIDLVEMVAGGMLQQLLQAASLVGTLDGVMLINDSVGFTCTTSYNSPTGALNLFLNTPPVGSLGDVMVDEDAAPTTVDLEAAYDDLQHADGQLTFTLTGNTNPSVFNSANIDNGNLTLSYAADQHGSSAITVRVTDPYGEYAETTFQVTVSSVNDEEVIVSNTGLTVAENSLYNLLSQSALLTTDVDNAADQLIYTLSSPTSNGWLLLSGMLLTTDDSFTQADINAGRIGYSHDGSETSADSFEFTVDDGSGTAASGTFTIAVTPVNDQTPVIASAAGGGATATLHIDENVTAVTQVTATDGDLPGQTLLYSIAGGADHALFTIDASTGVLQFISVRNREFAADANGDHIYAVIVQASDGSLFSQQSIEVVIDDVNEYAVAPAVDVNPLVNAVNENSAVGAPVGIIARAVDADATNNSITYSLDVDDQGRFAIHAATGEVYLVREVDYEADGPTRNIRVRATSSDGSSATTDYAITIGNINEVPQAASDAYTTSYIDDLIVNSPGVAGNDSDPDGNAIVVVLVHGPATGTARLSSNGSLLYHPQPGFVGTVELIYYVTDGSLDSALQTVSIQVTTPTNVPPPVESGGKDSSEAPPAKPAASQPERANPTPIQADDAADNDVVVVPSAAVVEARAGRTLQVAEAASMKTTETTLTFHPTIASHPQEQDMARMQLGESSRFSFKSTQFNHLVYAEEREGIEEEMVQDWVRHIDPYVATAVGTGIVIWLVHAGQFAAALLSTASTWVHVDPLTVLQGAQEIDQPETCEEKLFDGPDDLQPTNGSDT